jgi:hypothetical protein
VPAVDAVAVLCSQLAFCKLDEALVENAGVKLVKHAKQGDTTVVGGVCQITLLGHAHNCAWYLVYLLELPHQVAVL